MEKSFSSVLIEIVALITGITIHAADLDGDGLDDTSRSSRLPDDLDISKLEIISSRTNKTLSGIFELGNGGVSPGYFSGDFSIYTNYSTRNPDVSTYSFRWDENLQDWILYRLSSWSEPSRDEEYSLNGQRVPEELVLPTEFKVQRIKCCTKFSDFNRAPEITAMTPDDQRKEILDDFKKIEMLLSEGKSSTLYKVTDKDKLTIEKIPSPDFAYELSTIVGTAKPENINNYAYFLQQNDENIPAAIILKSIHDKYPERIVATLNLTDAYWGLGMKKAACPLYVEYVSKMNNAGKRLKIPKSALQRSDCNSNIKLDR
ncbi:hypothetical protein [Pseudomonas citronellolis]|uniref:hypothetical protein n=1 Tax=Pseudomonas citronellolis TaxID=53408 RepID=UPI002D782206|nr:hypothetical protein [Pseudomonas citronellolis]WRT85802.1 hypothetical protein VK748_15695 [Pseudomonas citronellolis]